MPAHLTALSADRQALGRFRGIEQILSPQRKVFLPRIHELPKT